MVIMCGAISNQNKWWLALAIGTLGDQRAKLRHCQRRQWGNNTYRDGFYPHSGESKAGRLRGLSEIVVVNKEEHESVDSCPSSTPPRCGKRECEIVKHHTRVLRASKLCTTHKGHTVGPEHRDGAHHSPESEVVIALQRSKKNTYHLQKLGGAVGGSADAIFLAT